jgi:hypothetical protein
MGAPLVYVGADKILAGKLKQFFAEFTKRV